MYLKHWNLTVGPFEQRVNRAWFYESSQHQGVLASLEHAVETQANTALLVGATGIGKSMVTAVLAESLAEDRYLLIRFEVSPHTAQQVFAGILCGLQQSGCDRTSDEANLAGSSASLSSGKGASSAVLSQLLGALQQVAAAGRRPVVLLDGAQWLEDSALIELIATVERLTIQGAGAMTLVVAGPTDLMVRARRFAQHGQSLVFESLIRALPEPETVRYVRHRLGLAGGDASIFSHAALELVHDFSGGVPRRINRLCDLGLLVGFAQRDEHVEPAHIRTAQSQFLTLAQTRTPATPTRYRWETPATPLLRVVG